MKIRRNLSFRIVLTASLIFSFSMGALAQNCLDSVYSGTATFYTVGSSGYCSFPVPASPVYIAAFNNALYDSSATCGSCLLVTSSSGMVTITVEDRCPGCASGTMDISSDADSILSPTGTPVAITWKYVGCPVTGNVQVYFQSSNPFYASLQIRNHRYPVKSVEFKSGSQYINLPRRIDNYFIADTGLGTQPFDFRITDILNDTIEVAGIPLVNDSIINTTAQFPTCTTAGIVTMGKELYELEVQNNPSVDGKFVLKNTNNFDVAYTLYDLLGKTLYKGKVHSNAETTLLTESKGMYLLNYTSTNGINQTRKLTMN